MGILSDFLKLPSSSTNRGSVMGLIDNGRNKNTGGHDHRTNKGDDRTPAQKHGDKKPNMDTN
jgi:hypothetical protein